MRILFLCRDHGARSRMAEALAQTLDEHQVASAGVTPAKLTAPALKALRDAGVAEPGPGKDIRSVDLSSFDLAVVVGGERDVAATLPATLKRVTWPLMEPEDPPAAPSEVRARYEELKTALDKHLLSLKSMKKRA